PPPHSPLAFSANSARILNMRIHRHRNRKPKLNVPQFKVNDRIKAPEVRVITEEGDLGVMTTEKAIALAEQKELDLVEVSPKGNPPVCKLLDYGHFKYQKEKEARKQKAQSKEVETKGVRLTFRIGEGDLNTRLNQAKKFLERGDKVKVELVLRGREKAHKPLAKEKVNDFLAKIREEYEIRVEQEATFQAGKMTAIIARA
ncbi:translation initiation factor IF-3, partial [Patescibacteria group bacterium]